MKKIKNFAAAALVLISPVVVADDAKISQIENALGLVVQLKGHEAETFNLLERMEKHGVPGVSVAFVEDGKIAWTKTWGVKNIETAEPVKVDSFFQAASISKPVAAYGAMVLVDQGKLPLHAPINSVLKQWQVPENEFTKQEAVTMARLLSHDAGMTVHGFGGYALDAPYPTVVDILNGIAPANSDAVVVDMVPGTKWRYSGGGYTVAQVAMEDAAGVGFVELMDNLILKPVGMTDSTYKQPLPVNRRAQAVTAYRTGLQPVEHQFHAYPEMAAAGLWTTPTDLAKLALSVRKAWNGEEGALLTPATAKDFLSVYQGKWGLGFQLDQKDGEVIGFSHGGANEGFRSNLLQLFDGRGVAIMTNSDTGGAIIAELMVAIASVYDLPVGHAKQVDWIPLDKAIGGKFAGIYRLVNEGQVVDFTVQYEGDNLVISNPKYLLPSNFYLAKQEAGGAHFFNTNGWELYFSGADTDVPVLHLFGKEAVKQ